MKVEKNNIWALGISLSSGNEEYPCALLVSLPGLYVRQDLPGWILRPYSEERTFKFAGDLNGTTYNELIEREYGVTLLDNHLHFEFGVQTDDSSTEKNKVLSLPWADWRHVRHSLYNLDHSVFQANVPGNYKAWKDATSSAPKVEFNALDFDGTPFVATARIEEREWRLGAGVFKWLGIFFGKTRRTLKLEFSEEIGEEKGSWKGGTVGHGIEIAPGEPPKQAFLRYCKQHNLSLVE